MPRPSIAIVAIAAIVILIVVVAEVLLAATGQDPINPGVVGAIVGATVSFVGVLMGQYLTGHTQREIEAQRA